MHPVAHFAGALVKVPSTGFTHYIQMFEAFSLAVSNLCTQPICRVFDA